MFNWKMIVLMLMPMLVAAGQQKVNEDTNETGKDDVIGKSLIFVAELLTAFVQGKAIPKVPDALIQAKGTVIKA